MIANPPERLAGLRSRKKDCKSAGTPGGLAFQKKEEEGML